MRPLLDTLAILPEARTEAIPSGCCGMAGAFGYESEHYDLPMRIGERASSATVARRDGVRGFRIRNGTDHGARAGRESHRS